MLSLHKVWRDIQRGASKSYRRGLALGLYSSPRAPFFMNADHAARAIRRMNRAVTRMHRLGLDADGIPTHIKRNAELARTQA